MDQFYSVLTSWWKGDPYDVVTMNIIAALPLEIAIIILRLLDPRSLVAAILVNRGWLRLIRSDAVLRSRVHKELKRERQAYWNLIDGNKKDGIFANQILDTVYYKHLHQLRPTVSRPKLVRPPPIVEAATPVAPQIQGVAEPLQNIPHVRCNEFLGLPYPAPLATSTPTATPRRSHVNKAPKQKPSRRLRDKIVNGKASCIRI